MAGAGFELPPENTGKTAVSAQSGTDSGALDAENGPDDHQLAEVIDAWPGLPDAVQADILAMIRAAGTDASPLVPLNAPSIRNLPKILPSW